MRAGLTNQKLALVGLALEGIRQSRPIILPLLTDFYAGRPEHPFVSLASVFDEERFKERAEAVGLHIVSDALEAEPLNGWDCFRSTTHKFARLRRSNELHPQAVPCALLEALSPSRRVADVASGAALSLQSRGVKVICQLRIENDWQAYAKKTLLERVGNTEDCPLTATEILQKLKNSIDIGHTPVYITCNEDDLSIKKSKIASEVQDKLGYSLLWKKDILEGSDISEWSYLEKAALDFEIAINGPYFVGTTRSTFFNIAALTCFCLGKPEDTRFLAYNVRGSDVIERTDQGAFAGAAEATMPRET
jgi:hypothetical protein